MNRLFRTTIVETSGIRTISGGGTNASNAGQALLNLLGVSITGDQTISGTKTFTTGIDIVNGTNSQRLRVFNLTGTNSGEYGLLGWQATGTGVAQNALVIGTQATQSGVLRDVILSGKNIMIPTGNLYIGTSGATASRIYFANPAGSNLSSITPSQYSLTIGGGSYTTLDINANFIATSSLFGIGNAGYLFSEGSAGFIGLKDTYGSNNTIGTNNQGFNIYKIYSGSNWANREFLTLGWTGFTGIIGTRIGTSGTLRDLIITGANININASGNTNFNTRPTVNNTGVMLSGDLNSASLSTSCGLTGNVLAGASDVIIPFTVKDDPRGWWNSSTNRWSPNISGRYYISYQINWATGTLGNQINSQIRKNANTVSLAQHAIPTVLNLTQNNTAIVTMNGTTGDYLDFTCYSSSTTPQYIIGSTDGAWTHFEAFRLSN